MVIYSLSKKSDAALKLRPIYPRVASSAAVSTTRNVLAKPVDDDPKVSNEPIPFFGSGASSWRAKDTRSGGSDESLWYQPYVISLSLGIFLLYFCALREENDIDKKLEGDLYNHVTGLEELQLSSNYRYNKENGLDNTEIITRLKALGVDPNNIN